MEFFDGFNWCAGLAIVGAVVLTFVLVWKRKFVCILCKTAPRDFRGAFRAIKYGASLGWLQLRGKSICAIFENNAKKYENKICFCFEDQEWTYGQMEELSNKVANYFASRGLAKGDTIGLFMENRVEYIALWMGLAKIGVVPALINTNLRLNPLLHSLKAVDCQSLIYGMELSSAVEEILGEEYMRNIILYRSGLGGGKSVFSNFIDVDSALITESSKKPTAAAVGFNDKLFYIYTSGTTGLPKAAVIKHSRFLLTALGMHFMAALTENDIVYTTMPLYHSASGMLGIGQALIHGSTVVFRKKFSASNFWLDCIRYRVTVAQYIGEICRYLLTQPEKPEQTSHNVRQMFGNGLRADIWVSFVNRFKIKNITEIYGSTEGNSNLVNFDGKVGAVGFLPRLVYPLSFMKLVKVDQDGEPIRDPKTGLLICCKPNEPGELVSSIYKGHPIRDFEGYADASSVKRKIATDVFKKGDSAFRSGDVLVMDELGYFYFKDRQGDTFRWKGENVSTTEVESIVMRICGLTDAAVYGVEIPGTDGRAGMAAIADPNGELNLDKLAAEITKELPPYARPLFVRLMHSIDMTGTHKIKKHDLQMEGFQISTIKDPIYFLTNGKYVAMDEMMFQNLMSGKIRV